MIKPLKMKEIILLVTALCTALISGLFYAYSCSVNIGLGQLRDAEYLSAMQAINKAIQNPVFFLSFMGTLVLLPLSAWLAHGPKPQAEFYLLAAAASVYLLGVFGVTVLGNVPLNDALANFDLSKATAAGITGQRLRFEGAWLFYHNIRTVACIISLVLVLLSLASDKWLERIG